VIEGIIGLRGVSKKSLFMMQLLADVLDMPIKIVRSEQMCVLGTGMFAATAAGIFETVEEQHQFVQRFDKVYKPNVVNTRTYRTLYKRYCSRERSLKTELNIYVF
jgi:L-ribulokinase